MAYARPSGSILAPPPRWQYRGVTGEIECLDTEVFRFQCVESIVEMKRPTEFVKAYPFIVIGG